jgi:hypothetical protein
VGTVNLSGSVIAGPPTAGEGFPAALTTVPLSFRSNPKSFGVASGVLTRQLNSSNAFVPLQGVGPTDTVTKADTLYLKSNGRIDLRLSIDDGSNGLDLRVITIDGLVVLEFDSSRSLKLLEAQGSATLEYFLSGQS